MPAILRAYEDKRRPGKIRLIEAFEKSPSICWAPRRRSSEASSASRRPARRCRSCFQRALWPGEWFDMHAYVGRIGTSTYEIAVKASLPDGAPVFEGSFTPICIPAGKERHPMALPVALRERLEASAVADPNPPY